MAPPVGLSAPAGLLADTGGHEGGGLLNPAHFHRENPYATLGGERGPRPARGGPRRTPCDAIDGDGSRMPVDFAWGSRFLCNCMSIRRTQ